jgi:hypothetical protein
MKGNDLMAFCLLQAGIDPSYDDLTSVGAPELTLMN